MRVDDRFDGSPNLGRYCWQIWRLITVLAHWDFAVHARPRRSFLSPEPKIARRTTSTFICDP
jgi:hypothetical protein